MAKQVFPIAAVLISTLALGAAAADEWARYEAENYGFSMLVPAGTKLQEREWADGWGGLYARHEGIELYGLARLGYQAAPEEIEEVGVELTGIGESQWTIIDEGEDAAGWKWYRTVKAGGDGRVAFGGYGVGEKGTYLLLLITSKEDFDEYWADYDEWYESIRLE